MKGSGVICLNGAAARLAQVGDIVIITYGIISDDELPSFTPKVALVDEFNRIVKMIDTEPPLTKQSNKDKIINEYYFIVIVINESISYCSFKNTKTIEFLLVF